MTTTYYAAPPRPGGGLWETSKGKPFRQLLRFRTSPRPDTALVLIDRDQHAVWEPETRVSLTRAAFGRYTEAHLVDTTRRSGVWQLMLSDRQAALEVTWWAADPRLVVLNRHLLNDPWAAVSGYLDGLLESVAARCRAVGRELTARDVLGQLTQPQHLPHLGLSCRVETTPPEFDALGPVVASPPQLWSPQRREEYEFYLQAVRTGPEALVALWLLHHPNEVRDVLEWVVDHPREITGVPDDDGGRALFDSLPGEMKEQLARADAEYPAGPPPYAAIDRDVPDRL
ncbi:hypothetical protein LE181_08150 [Streptomyces sp. SCA3-4]|uniref:hypothetical protein n=1 Tax=Streptomyces sichuanensis TaxID=2871810 RepID=UPI001CE39396|nr:hypothetical protein [Streptomyces sichuanensis]MCA6092131.1 hypothetical protein [Streptomyces sichuanensis]